MKASAAISKSDSNKLQEQDSIIQNLTLESNHKALAFAYLQKASLQKNADLDTSQFIKSITRAIHHAEHLDDANLKLWCTIELRQARYNTTVIQNKSEKLDLQIASFLGTEGLEDTIKQKAHNLRGVIFMNQNYYLQALDEFLLAQELAFNSKDSVQITENLIHLLSLYEVLKDDKSFESTKALISSFMPKNNNALKSHFYLKLRVLGGMHTQAERDSFLFKAIKYSRGINRLDFSVKKELAIYHFDHNEPEKGKQIIEYLKTAYLNKKPKHAYTAIHIEELNARYYYTKDKFKLARYHYKLALDYCDELRSPTLKRDLLFIMLNLSKDLDDYKLAYQSIRSLKLLEDSTMNRSQLLHYQKLKSRLEQEQTLKQISQLQFKKRLAELEVKTKNSDILWLSFTALVLLASLLIIFISYNQKRKRSKELKALNNLKDFIFSVISHDLRSPLYHFNTLLNMAENKYLKEEEYSEYLKTIKTELQGITGITESLLRWAKSNQGLLKVNLSQISLLAVLNEITNAFIPEMTRKNIRIVSNFKSDFTFNTDKDLFSFILRNILQNAIKFSGENGEIEINAKKENNCFSIKVVDHGSGMSKEQLANINRKISDPNFDINGSKSTGLGLIIARDFAQRLNMKNKITSAIGSGTSVELSFCQTLTQQ